MGPDAFGIAFGVAFGLSFDPFGANISFATVCGIADPPLGRPPFFGTHFSCQAFFSLSNINLPSKMGSPQPLHFGPNSLAQHGRSQYNLPFSTLNFSPLSCFP